MSRVVGTVIGFLVLSLAGCKDRRSIDELADAARKAREEARAGLEAADPGAADKAAKKAEKAASTVKERTDAAVAKAKEDGAERPSEAEEVRTLDTAGREIRKLAREARFDADLAAEREELADRLGSWKAAAYNKAREVAIPALFDGLAAAAEAARDRPAGSPEGATLANVASGVAALMADSPGSPQGNPDWNAVASTLRGRATSQPWTLRLQIAAGLALLGKGDLALFELSPVPVESMSTPAQRLVLRVARGFVYRMVGFRCLATLEFEAAAGPDCLGASREYGRYLEAGVHMFVAALYLENKDYEQADVEIMRLVQAWPDGPVAQLLTGERMAANGEWEKAAMSLETVSKQTDDKWLVDKVMQRAREIRDSRGAPEPLLSDPAFLRELTFHFAVQAAKESEAGRRVQRFLEDARTMVESFVAGLPGIG